MLSQKLVIHILQFKDIYYFLLNIYIYICVMEKMYENCPQDKIWEIKS